MLIRQWFPATRKAPSVQVITIVDQNFDMLYIFSVVHLRLKLAVVEKSQNSALFGCYIPSEFRYAIKYCVQNLQGPVVLLC